jgi:hypothetical protein
VSAVTLRGGVEIEDPLAVALGFLEAYGDDQPAEEPNAFDERDLRRANRGGARISAAEIAAVLGRRRQIEAALRAIDPAASLAQRSVPWAALTQLFEGFADIRGVGFAKTTKALHPKRPALIPMLDSVVVRHLEAAEPIKLPFAEHAMALVRRYKRDLDWNRAALHEVGRALAADGYRLTEVRILDMLVWSVAANIGAATARSDDGGDEGELATRPRHDES